MTRGVVRVVRAVFACCALALALDVVESMAAKPGYFWYVDFGWVTFVAYAVAAAVLRLRWLPAPAAFAAVAAGAFTHALFGPLIVVDLFHLHFGRPSDSMQVGAFHALWGGLWAAALGVAAVAVWNRFRAVEPVRAPMTTRAMLMRPLVVLAVAIVALDAVESVISRAAGIPYARFMPVQVVVYLAIGVALRRRGLRLGQTALAVAITAVVEATAGEWVALAIGAARPTPLAVQLVVVPLAIGFEVALACLGFAFAGLRFARRPG